jgi:hypothetical protein
MLWLTWRQHRLQLLALAAVACVLVAEVIRKALPLVEPSRLMHACASGVTTDCDDTWEVVGVDGGLMITLAAINLLPALVGAFWGAPLIAREYERGTHRLVWAQTVSRRRWLASKVAVLGTAAVLGGVAQAVALTWATDQFAVMQTVHRFSDRTLFDIAGVVPPALWLFALALGIAVGLLVRRTTAAMAVTLVLLGVVLLGLSVARPHYATPLVREGGTSLDTPYEVYGPREDWVLQSGHRGPDGRILSSQARWDLCGSNNPEVEFNCLGRHGLVQVDIYHPQRRYWRFQWTEAGILFAGALLIGAYVFIRVSRRAD